MYRHGYGVGHHHICTLSSLLGKMRERKKKRGKKKAKQKGQKNEGRSDLNGALHLLHTKSHFSVHANTRQQRKVDDDEDEDAPVKRR